MLLVVFLVQRVHTEATCHGPVVTVVEWERTTLPLANLHVLLALLVNTKAVVVLSHASVVLQVPTH